MIKDKYGVEYPDFMSDLLLYRDVISTDCIYKVKDILITDKEFNMFLKQCFKTKEDFSSLKLEEIIYQTSLFYDLIYCNSAKVYCKAIINDFNHEYLLLLFLTDRQKKSWNKAKIALNEDYKKLLKTFQIK